MDVAQQERGWQRPSRCPGPRRRHGLVRRDEVLHILQSQEAYLLAHWLGEEGSQGAANGPRVSGAEFTPRMESALLNGEELEDDCAAGVKLEFRPDTDSEAGVKKTSGYEPRMGRGLAWDTHLEAMSLDEKLSPREGSVTRKDVLGIWSFRSPRGDLGGQWFEEIAFLRRPERGAERSGTRRREPDPQASDVLPTV